MKNAVKETGKDKETKSANAFGIRTGLKSGVVADPNCMATCNYEANCLKTRCGI